MAWNIGDKPTVKICIPHWGTVTLEWAQKVMGPLQFLQHPDFNKDLLMMRGILNLDTERNELVKMALGDPRTTHLMWIDTDIMPENPPNINDCIAQLLKFNRPIVSGLYRAKQKQGFNYAAWMHAPNGISGYVPIANWTPGSNWISVDVIGFGFVLVKREVFEKVGYPWFKWDQVGPSEDFYFCERAKSLGYDVNVCTDIKCTHEGKVTISCDGQVGLNTI